MISSFVEIKGESEIAGKGMTNKHAVDIFWKTCTASGHYFAKSETYTVNTLN